MEPLNNNMEIEIARLIEKNIDGISVSTAKKVFEESSAYRKSSIKEEESVTTCKNFLTYLISYLKEGAQIRKFDKSKLMSDIVKFEDGIAARRLRYEIDLKDVLNAIFIFKNCVWNFIKEQYGGKINNSEDFFELEKKINDFFITHIIDITDAYIKLHKEIMTSQEAAFRKWETVVKSAHNIELNIPCREAYASVARMQAEAIARRLRFDEEKVQDIKVAVGEACGNAIEHGSSRNGVDIHYHIMPGSLSVEVKDYGQGFTPPKPGEADLPLDIFSERGRGMYIMQALMDKVDVQSAPGEGTLIVLDKKM